MHCDIKVTRKRLLWSSQRRMGRSERRMGGVRGGWGAPSDAPDKKGSFVGKRTLVSHKQSRNKGA